MQFPESWLRAFCNPPLNTAELAHCLTMGGFEVEETKPVAPPFTAVVVGEIKACVQHPNADRLRVVQVDVGQGALLDIVCGAPNARIGIKVPCALVGAMLPPGADGAPFQIKLGKLRGIESQGMLCSAKELGVSDESAGLLELDAAAVVGTSIREHLNLDDTVFTVKLTPNLGHALSVYGMARELSALTGAPLELPHFEPFAVNMQEVLPVKVSAPDLCGRFSGRVIRHINTQAKTPTWMVERLARCGQRSVTALVDISNYVMFEFGRPTHIFDLARIHGGLDVRWAQSGETLKLLNGQTVTLDPRVGVIADAQGVESLAGIMGGDSTAVSDGTQAVYVEAAFWWPDSVAGRSRRFNFATDAGHRFERGVDPELTVAHLEHITRLIVDICGTDHTQVGPIDDQQPNMPPPRQVQLRASRASKVIGMPLTRTQCAQALKRCGFSPTLNDDEDTLRVYAPGHRFDVVLEEDLIEEVARIEGYDNLPTTAPLAPTMASTPPESRRSLHAVRRQVAQLGYTETINFSFVDAEQEQRLSTGTNPIRLLNPIASQLNVMRSQLLGSLLQVLRHNLDRNASDLRLFELGRVFSRDASVIDTHTSVAGIAQPMRLGGLTYGMSSPTQWGTKATPIDFFDVKADVEALLGGRATFAQASHPALHPGRCASVSLDGEVIGVVGELHPQWRQAYELAHAPILFELDAQAVASAILPNAQAVAKFQAVERDIAVVVAAEVTFSQIMVAAQSAPTQGMLSDLRLFDIYRPKVESAGMSTTEKSCALRLSLASATRTLTEPEIEGVVAAVLAALSQQLGARLRT